VRTPVSQPPAIIAATTAAARAIPLVVITSSQLFCGRLALIQHRTATDTTCRMARSVMHVAKARKV
jgi:hypothetical protein